MSKLRYNIILTIHIAATRPGTHTFLPILILRIGFVSSKRDNNYREICENILLIP